MAKKNIEEMKAAYCHLYFEEGMSPHKIAEKFGLSDQTVYNHLEEIARDNGYERSQLVGKRRSKAKAIKTDKTENAAPIDKVEAETEVESEVEAETEATAEVEIIDFDNVVNAVGKLLSNLESISAKKHPEWR